MNGVSDIGKLLEEFAMLGERERKMALAPEMGYAFVDLDRITVAPDAIEALPSGIARERRVLPVKKQDNTLYLALDNPNDLEALDAVSLATAMRVIPVLAEGVQIEKALDRYYPLAME